MSEAAAAASIIIPEKEIEELYQMYHALSNTEIILQSYKAMTNKLTDSIESLHLLLFQLEQKIKDPFILLTYTELSNSEKQLAQLETSLNDRLFPFISVTLSEVNDNILCNLAEDNSNHAFVATKLQSDIASLQSYIASVKQLVFRRSETLALDQEMERVYMQMETMSDTMFEYQEKRLMSTATTINPISLTSSSSVSTSSLSNTPYSVRNSHPPHLNALFPNGILMDEESSINSVNSIFADHCTHSNNINEMHDCGDDQQDAAMAAIEALFSSLLQSMDQVCQRMAVHQQQQQHQSGQSFKSMSTNAALITMNLSDRKFEKLRVKWEEVLTEREDLRATYREDRWFNVFRRVSDQVDVMMNGLDRSTAQCYSFIQHIWQQQQKQEDPILLPPTPTSSTFDNSKYNTKKPTCLLLTKTEQEKFKSLERSFEAKMKYYTPSIDRMLSILGNGIHVRAANAAYLHQSIILRHESLLQRWQHVKEIMDDLRHRDLPEMERMLTASTTITHVSTSQIPPLPPATPTSIMSNGSSTNNKNLKSIWYRTTPEPSSSPRENYGHMMQSVTPRSITPNSNIALEKLSSEDSPQQQMHSFYHHQYQSSHQSTLYESTVNKGIGSLMKRTAASPKPTRQLSTRLMHATPRSSKAMEDFYEEDERHFGIDISSMIKQQQQQQQQQQEYIRGSGKTPTSGRATNKRSNSSNTRNLNIATPQQQQAAGNKAKLRSKSSMGHFTVHRSVLPASSNNKAVSSGRLSALPMQRRAMTPSLIPRPRTPKDSMISRNPPSSLAGAPLYAGRRSSSTSTSLIPEKQQQAIPPVPPLPKYVTLRQQQERRLTNSSDDTYSSSSSSNNSSYYHYHPDPKDPLDIEVAKIINASPITMECQRVGPTKHPGKYYFGNDAVNILKEAGNSRKKMYTCKLMTYEDRGRRGPSRQQHPSATAKNNKVLVRVGGGWQDLEFFLLEHSSLMSSNNTK